MNRIIQTIVLVAILVFTEIKVNHSADAIRGLAEECRSPETTDADIEMVFSDEVEMSHEAKCVGACMFKKLGIMNDGKFNVEVTKKMIEFLAPDENDRKEKFEIIDKCGVLEDEDECELAYKIEMCTLKIK